MYQAGSNEVKHLSQTRRKGGKPLPIEYCKKMQIVSQAFNANSWNNLVYV